MKTNLDESFKTSGDLETNGVWFEVNDNVAFLIKRFGGRNRTEVAKKMAQLQKPYAKQIQMNTIDQSLLEKINMKVFVESSIVDWRGLTIDGEETPFTKEKCLELLLDMPDLAESLVSYASDASSYMEYLGNS